MLGAALVGGVPAGRWEEARLGGTRLAGGLFEALASVNGRELLGLLLRIGTLGPFDHLWSILLVLIHRYLGLERVFIHLLE